MDSVKEAPQTPEAPAPATTPAEAVKQNTVPRFRVGEQLPWKGILFQLERVDKDGVFLKAVGYTGKERKR